MADLIGEVRTKRIKVSTFKRELTVPNKMSNVRIANVGLNDIKISFENDGMGDFVVLEKQDKLPIIGIRGGKTKITHQSLLGEGLLELLFWG